MRRFTIKAHGQGQKRELWGDLTWVRGSHIILHGCRGQRCDPRVEGRNTKVEC